MNNRVTTALHLAAGTGSRLRPLTLDAPKCLTEVGGESILGRLVDSLRLNGIRRLVVVTGYLDHCIRNFLQQNASDIEIEYVFNPDYRTTNNIYSLWLAQQAIKDPFVLIESDLVFADSLLAPMLTPDRIAISKTLDWMNGTAVELNGDNCIKAFHEGPDYGPKHYKTVNIYSLSLASWRKVVGRLDEAVKRGRLGEYYETVFAEMVLDGSLDLSAVFFDENKWYEVDCMKDLHQAELMFPRALPARLAHNAIPRQVLARPVGPVELKFSNKSVA